MPIKTIKDVDEDTWRKLKILSAEENMRVGKLLRNITENYIKNRTDVWAKILDGRKILSDKEADEIEKVVKKSRKESGFR